jgi:undecaprenyl diphosphate synthase
VCVQSKKIQESQQFPLSLRHIAMIMDGNGRWAESHHKPRIEGHRSGAQTVRMVVQECRRIGVKYLTLYAFSTENWSRPQDEVQALMQLLHFHLLSEIEELSRNGVCVRVIGDRSFLASHVREAIERAEALTANNEELQLILAISYGGRREIVDAVRAIADKVRKGELVPEDVDEGMVSSHLYLPGVPDPDLLIRTSNESRISNFLLWQMAYTEIVISPLHWPDFSKDGFYDCLRQYASRNRRFGLTAQQAPPVLGPAGSDFFASLNEVV